MQPENGKSPISREIKVQRVPGRVRMVVNWIRYSCTRGLDSRVISSTRNLSFLNI